MRAAAKSIIIILFTALSFTGCSSSSEPKKDPYNDADSQRSRAHQTQGELSRETSK